MTNNQRKDLMELMGKTEEFCSKAMGEQFCAEHNQNCEQCLADFMDIMFAKYTGCKCRYCKKQGCGDYHAQCEHYKIFASNLAEKRRIRDFNNKCKYIKKRW